VIKGVIRCWNAPPEKIVRALTKFANSHEAEFKMVSRDDESFIAWRLKTHADFMNLVRRMRQIKGIRLVYARL
jgi:hypothetical protein